MAKPNGRGDHWLTGVRKAFIREGASLKKAARVVSEAMDAEYVEVVKHEGSITEERSYIDHRIRLAAAETALGVFAPRTAGGGVGEGRMVLNVQAGAAVQLVYFGEAKEPLELPAAPVSPELKQVLIRQGKIAPDGSPEAPKALETPKALPEAKPNGDGWLK
ncbi:MAG TPA: hypothetical protein VI337_01485 [Nitrospirales bacterium]|nr:hypothetical protein [Nitrospirales bacterium]